MTNCPFRVFLGTWNDTQNLEMPKHHLCIAEWIEKKSVWENENFF